MVHQRSDWKDIPLDDLQRKGVVVVGDPGEVAEHLNRYVEAGCRYFQLYGLPLDLDEQFETLELYATHILPQFR
ncbi:MAG: hypothetical protein HW414_1885 [Dehalococcoidia bacterium]|nr:hypothetical protein [Dehalococcoidia bacterium]